MIHITRKTSFNFYITFFSCIFFIGLFLTEVLSDLRPLMTGFFVLYVVTVLLSVYYFGWLSLYSIYLYTSAFFMYDCIFISLLTEPTAFLIQDFPVRYSFSEEVGKIFIICCFFTVFFGHLSYCWFTRKEKSDFTIPVVYNFKYISKLEKIGSWIFFLALFPVCHKILIQLQFVMIYGFPAVYTSKFNELQYPIWCTGAFLIFNTGYLIFLASNPSKKKFFIYSTIYICIYFFNALKGGRGGIITILIVTLFWYTKKYNGKINFKKLLLFLVIVFILISFISSLRESYDGQSGFSNLGLLDKLKTILWSQTTSRAVPMLIIQGDLQYHSYPFIFSPFTERILHIIYNYVPATLEWIQTFNEPSIVLISNVSLEAGLSGSGYGSAFIGEAYELGGYLGIIFFTIVMSWFLFFLEVKTINLKNIYIPLYYVSISNIPFAPRKEIFQFVRFDLNGILVCYIAVFVATFLLTKTKGKIING